MEQRESITEIRRQAAVSQRRSTARRCDHSTNFASLAWAALIGLLIFGGIFVGWFLV